LVGIPNPRHLCWNVASLLTLIAVSKRDLVQQLKALMVDICRAKEEGRVLDEMILRHRYEQAVDETSN